MSEADVIFVSGWAHSNASIDNLEKAMPDLNVISTCPGELLSKSMSIDALSPYCSALIKTQSSAEPVLIGWSTGAIIVLEAIAAGMGCSKAILISGTARFCNTSGYEQGTDTRAVRGMRLGLKSNKTEILNSFYRQSCAPLPADNEQLNSFMNTSGGMETSALARGLQYLEETDLRAKLSEVNVPTLLIHGTSDAIIPSTASDFINKELSDSTLKYYNNAGHNLLVSHPAELVSDIKSFIKEQN